MLLKVHMHTTFFDTATVPMWQQMSRATYRGEKKPKKQETFSPSVNEFLRQKKTKPKTWTENGILTSSSSSSAVLFKWGGMSLWHSQLLARQHGLLPIIPGWRWDFSTPRGGAEKAKLLRLSKLFCARCETDHLRSMGPMRKKKYISRDVASFLKIICEFRHFQWGTSRVVRVRGGACLCSKRSI